MSTSKVPAGIRQRERQKLPEDAPMVPSEGCRARSKATDLGSVLEAVQEFESPPSHLKTRFFRWNCDFGEGTYSTAKNPVHTYLRTGNYTVTLTVFRVDRGTLVKNVTTRHDLVRVG
jgi:hypothetical protein